MPETPAERESFLDYLRKELPNWVGKFVQVKMRQIKDLQSAPGAADQEVGQGYYLVTYQGDIVGLKPFPEDNPNGTLCLYLQERQGQQRLWALAVLMIDEVDDEVRPPTPLHVDVSGLNTSR